MFDKDAIRRRAGDALDERPTLWHMIQVPKFRNSRVLRKLVTPELDLVLEGISCCENIFRQRDFVCANQRVHAWAIATHAQIQDVAL